MNITNRKSKWFAIQSNLTKSYRIWTEVSLWLSGVSELSELRIILLCQISAKSAKMSDLIDTLRQFDHTKKLGCLRNRQSSLCRFLSCIEADKTSAKDLGLLWTEVWDKIPGCADVMEWGGTLQSVSTATAVHVELVEWGDNLRRCYSFLYLAWQNEFTRRGTNNGEDKPMSKMS